jgi:hypothetical protein
MSDEVMKILKLLENGKINAEEAERLISAVSGQSRKGGFYVPPPQKPPKMPKDFVRRIEIIPDQVGQAISAAFGSVGSNAGRKTFPDAKEFAIKVVSGNLEIAPGGDEIAFDGAAWPMKSSMENDRLVINAINTNAVLEVPEDIEGIVNAVSADVSAKGLRAKIQIEQVSGDVAVENCTGDWKIATISGDVEIEEFTGNLLVRSRNGDISLTIAGPGEYTADTISGDIEVGYPDGYVVEMNAKSREGVVDLAENRESTEITKEGKISLTLKSVNGDITIRE